jgi:hypothetical protein
MSEVSARRLELPSGDMKELDGYSMRLGTPTEPRHKQRTSAENLH